MHSSLSQHPERERVTRLTSHFQDSDQYVFKSLQNAYYVKQIHFVHLLVSLDAFNFWLQLNLLKPLNCFS